MEQTQDVRVFYDKLSQQQMDTLDQSEQLPPLAVRWAREAEDGPMAFAVIDDVNQCKTLIRQSNQLIDKLTALTEASNRVRAFPELAAGEERALSLINRISRARVQIAEGLDSEEPSEVSGEIAGVRAQRRALMAQMKGLPIENRDFIEREQQGVGQWNRVSQELTRRNLEIDQLQAIINGLRRWLREDAQRGVTRDAPTMQRFNTELDENEKLLKGFREQATDIRRQIEYGRFQIGIGDARYQADALGRVQFRDILDREVQLAAGGAAGGSAQRYAQRVQPILAQARTTEDKLVAAFAQLEAEVARKIGDVRAKIDAEKAKMQGFQAQLDKLDNEARDLVGQVAKRNFGYVRDKLRGIVLRADVGITEQAWEVREEELERVHSLQTERAREEQLLDEELREVLDDSGEAPKATGGAGGK
jgi:hypothetical protein